MVNHSNIWREVRHNPCVMQPVTASLLLIVLLAWAILGLLKIPGLVLGILLSAALDRANFVVEFLYIGNLGRFLHIFGMKYMAKLRKANSNDSNNGFHSRSSETRVQLSDRIFIHPLPQFLDNLGYLVVCLPEERVKTQRHSSALGKITVEETAETEIVAFMVDCGDAQTVQKHLKIISETFYKQKSICLQSVLSTHKHHDHTAGNREILKLDSVKLIFGGAVDNVPACNYPVSNGDKLPLPKAGNNDMNELIEVEAVATPAHTRGSITYVLRTLNNDSCCLFTGDTVFSAGGGVPFEADVDPNQEEKANKMTANSYIKATAAANAVERCFAEVLFRSTGIGTTDDLLVFPGHEYTQELLSRQFSDLKSSKWRQWTPTTFFQTVSHLYVSTHRRTLPHNSGRLMTVPSTVKREVSINPHFRSLKQRGTVVLQAIKLWNRHFARTRTENYGLSAFAHNKGPTFRKLTAQDDQWNLSTADLNREVFTTLYAADLDTLIEDLSSSRIDSVEAAERLKELKESMDAPVVGRRPIPGTTPSSKNIYRGLLGFVLLGSSPAALSMSDSKKMNLPAPVDTSSDRIRVSKKRLVSVLYWLGLLDGRNSKYLVDIIHQLWKETHAYVEQSSKVARGSSESDTEDTYKTHGRDVESTDEYDELDLGALKWMIYGIPEQERFSFPRFCSPCRSKNDDLPSEEHPASRLKRHAGELVRHDVFQCRLCRDATGCPCIQVEEMNDVERPTVQTISESFRLESSEEEADSARSIEVSPLGALDSLLMKEAA